MKPQYYVLCGENGLLIKSAKTPYLRIQEYLVRYMKGENFVKHCTSLIEAQTFACNYALNQNPPIRLRNVPQLDQMILFREHITLIDPIVSI